MNADAVLDSLRSCPFEIEGRILAASNATLRCTTETGTSIVYKPLRGERPLWDFPEGTLTGREVACFEIDRAMGFNLVPPTVWRDDGPAGPGMCQLWVEEDDDSRLVDVVSADVVPANRLPPDWISVLRASDGRGNPVELVHANDARLQQMAVLDAVINNGDRKGGHVITDIGGSVWGVDHGVTLSVEPKLRTVLWGWAGSPISVELRSALESLSDQLGSGLPQVERWLDKWEVDALRVRVADLLDSGRFPYPNEDWPAIPWPVF